MWAVGTLLALMTIALLVGLLVVNLDSVKWENLSRERIEQVALFIGIAVAATTLIVLLAIGGASLGWTGFQEKTVWDFLQLLIVPLMLVAIGLVFSLQQDARQQRVEDQRAEAERELAEQRAQDEALQAYLDQMSQLMLERKLLEAEQGDPVYTLAQARTSTVILRLDAEHSASVIRFLRDSGLARSGEASVSILRGIALERADLSGADLKELDLREADLLGADLSSADLREADLREADLSVADLREADLHDDNLSSASLYDANLGYANLGYANLSDANLFKVNLSGATLFAADLNNVFLNQADLSDAHAITNEKLEQQAYSLEGATMPNGQKYEDWLKSKEG